MFISKKKLKAVLTDSMFEALTTSGSSLADEAKIRAELEDLKLKKKMEEEEIKHLVKLERERQAVENQKTLLKMQEEFNGKESKLRQEFFDKNMAIIKEGHQKMQEIYMQILERLPNVNMEITRKSK